VIINWGRGPYWDGPGLVRSRPFPPQPILRESAADNANVALTSTAAIAGHSSVSDTLNVAVTEAAVISLYRSASDSIAVAATESLTATGSTGAQAGYIGGPVVIGRSARRVFRSLARTADALDVSTTEAASVTPHTAASDNLDVAVTNAASVAVAELAQSASDSAAVAVTESSAVRFPKIASDTLAVAVANSGRLIRATANLSGSDTLPVSFTETSNVSLNTTTIPQQVGNGTQTGYLGGTVYIGTGQRFIPKPAGPGGSLSVALGEAATVSVHLSASDTIGVGSTPGSSDDVITPITFGQTLVTVDTLALAFREGAFVSSTSGTVVNWATLIDPDLSIRVFEEASVVTINNQRLYNEVVAIRLTEQASRLHIFPTGGTTPPTVGDTVNVGVGEGFQNSFTGAGSSRLGTYGYLQLSIVETAIIGIASTAQAFNTATWLEVAFTAQGVGVLLSQCGIEVIYKRVPARTTTDTAWPTTAQIQQDYPPESYIDFSFTG
jgi:hypothetical protein